jgi:CubicO group peptidase (beta-lactamase class C family)
MMQPARDQDAQVQQILDRLGITPHQVLHHHHTFGDRLSASTERLGAIIPEPVLPPIADGLRWRINPETLHANLQAALDPLGVGFCYIINRGGRLFAHHRSGEARVSLTMPWLGIVADPGLAWDIDVPTDICSVSKFITAIATLMLLEREGVSPLTPVANYLPDYWQLPVGNASITFHQLLRHESGLGGQFTGSGAEGFTIARVQMEINAVGIGTYRYKNFNFLILRAALPVLAGVVPPEMSAGASLNDSLWDEVTRTFYRQFCNDHIFAAAGVGPFDFLAPPDSAFAYPTPPAWPGAQRADGWIAAGSSAWFLTLEELMKVAAAFRYGGSMMSQNRANDLMTAQYGLNEVVNTNAGSVYAKRGNYISGANELETGLWFIPDDIELGMFINSRRPVSGSYNDAIGPAIAASAEVAV